MSGVLLYHGSEGRLSKIFTVRLQTPIDAEKKHGEQGNSWPWRWQIPLLDRQ